MPEHDTDCPRCRGGGCEWCHNTGKHPVTVCDIIPMRRSGHNPIRVKRGENTCGGPART